MLPDVALDSLNAIANFEFDTVLPLTPRSKSTTVSDA